MGCDIHGFIEGNLGYGMDPHEKNPKYKYWHCLGDIPLGRNYEIFAVLGNVRNEGNIPFIGENRFNDLEHEPMSEAFQDLCKKWNEDGHSHSYVTLEEMYAFDATQKAYSPRLVTSRDKDGNITGTCSMTTGKHLGEVGLCNIFGPWGNQAWFDLRNKVEEVARTWDIENFCDIRLAFFFDN